jgi:manganese-dependent ADP-ribose/CDP-alcohol diphosphatase
VPYNGGFGRAQLEWLDQELRAAAVVGERVVLNSHVLLDPRAGDGTWRRIVHRRELSATNIVRLSGSTATWDFEQAMEIIHRYSCVAAVLCGHDHPGGYVLDERGIHHVTFESPLNCSNGEACSAVVEVYDDRIEIRGLGLVTSRVLKLVGIEAQRPASQV